MLQVLASRTFVTQDSHHGIRKYTKILVKQVQKNKNPTMANQGVKYLAGPTTPFNTHPSPVL